MTVPMPLEKISSQTDKPFAINIPILLPNAADICKLALEMGVKIFITAAGLPEKIIPFLKQSHVTAIHVVPSVKGAKKAVAAGADAVVCEGYEAGGHNSPLEVTTFALIPQVADAVDVPVVAAGGIADGRGIAAAMSLGADGVQMGTRFIATEECNIHDAFKKLILTADDTGTCVIGRQFNLMRVIRNEFAEKMAQAEKAGASVEDLFKIIGDERNRNRAAAKEGDIVEGAFQAGQSAGLIDDMPTVMELIKRLVAAYESARQALKPLGGSKASNGHQ